MMTDHEFAEMLDLLRDLSTGATLGHDKLGDLLQETENDPERRALLEEALAFRATFAPARDASRRREPAEENLLADFERRTGISSDELDAVLPAATSVAPREVPSDAPAADSLSRAPHRNRGAVHEPAPFAADTGDTSRGLVTRRAAKVRPVALVAVPALVLAFCLALATSAITTPDSVKWALNEARLNAADRDAAPSATRGAASDATDNAKLPSAVSMGWSALRAARTTTIGLFPRFSESGVEAAATQFERAAEYAGAPTDIRGEALYGLALTTWLRGERQLAITILNDSAIPYSGAADSAKALREALQRESTR